MTRDIILVSSGYDMCIRFWSDFNDSKCKHSIEYKDAAINALEITPNKEYVAFASQNSVKFIDLVSLNSTPVRLFYLGILHRFSRRSCIEYPFSSGF
jgi:WD40 repeat protein